MTSKQLRFIVVMVLLAGVAAFFMLGGPDYLTLQNLKAQKDWLLSYYQQRPVFMVLAYMGLYIVVTALSLPGAAILTLAGGYLFGLVVGTLAVSFASTIGATLAFLVARFLLYDWVQTRFGSKLTAINEGIKRDGAFYLFTMRLIPAIPFFVINLVMGLTPISVWKFYIVSQIGMLPGTIVYVNAGKELSKIDSLSGILSPQLIAAFVLLGIFPLIARKVLNFWKRKRVFARYNRPAKYDYNVVVIGAGAAGLVSAYISAAVKAKVALIEKNLMGGDCLNTGCVPSKALIQSAKMLSYAKRCQEFGLKSVTVDYSFSDVMERVQSVIQKVAPHDSVERYTSLGVDCIQGCGCIKSPFEVEVNGRILTTKNIIVAAGAEPVVPAFPGLDQVPYYTTDTIWSLREQPQRLLILGGGPIGSELAQAFNRLGSHVIQVERADRILNREDPDVSQLITERFKEEGVEVLTSHEAQSFARDEQGPYVVLKHQGQEKTIYFDAVLLALGRRARTEGYGLEHINVELTPGGTIAVNEYLQTSVPNVFVCGDVAGPYQFTHAAAHQAWYCAVNALFWPFKQFKVDYRVLPWTTFTDPEVGRVGLNETEAQQKGIPHEVTIYGIDDLDRAIADSEAHGFVKVITAQGKDQVLGATVVSVHGGELVTEFVSAMKHGFGLNKILGTIHAYPTMAEANKYAAGVWKKNHAPENILAWLEKLHAWRRHH